MIVGPTYFQWFMEIGLVDLISQTGTETFWSGKFPSQIDVLE